MAHIIPAMMNHNRLNLNWLRKSPARLLLALAFSVALTVVSASQQRAVCIVTVTLLQLNDVYQFTPVDHGARGGLARVITLKKQVEQQNPHTLFLFAGDTIAPSVESITYKGAQMIESWNTAKLDYATFGNHEFDFGPAVLNERMKESKFRWLAANVIDKKTGKPFGNAEAFAIREFDGVKVGIFGLVLPSTKTESRPGPDVEFLDPCETARSVVPQLREQGAKAVVALTHLSMSEDKKVAKCAEIDVIVGGHEHTLLQSEAGGAPIFKMTSDARELGKIDLNISKDSGRVESIDWRIIPVTKEVQEAPEFASITNKYARLMPHLARVVGTTRVPLDARSKESRTQETNVGNFVTDAFRAATSSDVALINGGSIRADTILVPGRLTRRDLLSILPYANKIVKLEVSGKTLREIMEHGVARTAEDAEPGRFPQVSGVKFSFDASRPPGSRIVDIKVNGRPLDEARTYTLATTNFLSGGGDDYSMLKSQRLLITPEQGQTDTSVLEKLMRTKPIAARVEGRIVRLDRSQKTWTGCN